MAYLPLLPTEELDLTKLDRQTILARLQAQAYQANPLWSDFSLNFQENILLESQAMLTAMELDVVNERVRQLSLATVTDRLALIRMVRLFGFEVSSAQAAQVTGTFALPNGALASSIVTLPAGLRIESGGKMWRLTAASTIPVGSNTSGTVTLENSEEQEDGFVSDEVANMHYQLDASPYVADSLVVTASDGVYYDYNPSTGRKYRSLLEVGPDDLAYISRVDNQGRVHVFFGNSINGKIPQGNITFEYRTTDGEDGRVSASASWSVLDTVYDALNDPTTVQFSNSGASTGGYDQMSVEEAKVRAPQALRTLERCVNESDFEYAATTVGGLARAACLTSNHDSTVQEDACTVHLVALGTPYSDSGYYPPATPTAAQIAAVVALYEQTGTYPALMGVDVTVVAATFEVVTVAAKLYKDSGYTAAEVKTNVTRALQKLFAVSNDLRMPNSLMDFGYLLKDADGDPDYKIPWSVVLNAINDADGVREISPDTTNLLLNGSRQSVVLQPKGFPLLSTITLYDMDNSGQVM